MEFICENEQETRELACRIAEVLRPADVISMQGSLGVGKSFFVRSVVRKFLEDENVPSPTFTLVQIYETEIGSIWHFDLYRLQSPDEIYELGMEEAFIDGICFIEWAERAANLLPERLHTIGLEIISATGRRIVISDGLAERLKK